MDLPEQQMIQNGFNPRLHLDEQNCIYSDMLFLSQYLWTEPQIQILQIRFPSAFSPPGSSYKELLREITFYSQRYYP